MKTEKFDEEIKRKVENLIPKTEEKEVDKVLAYITANTVVTVAGVLYRRLIILGCGALLVTGIITWQLTRMHDREEMKQTIAQLNKNHAQKQNLPLSLPKTATVSQNARNEKSTGTVTQPSQKDQPTSLSTSMGIHGDKAMNKDAKSSHGTHARKHSVTQTIADLQNPAPKTIAENKTAQKDSRNARNGIGNQQETAITDKGPVDNQTENLTSDKNLTKDQSTTPDKNLANDQNKVDMGNNATKTEMGDEKKEVQVVSPELKENQTLALKKEAADTGNINGYRAPKTDKEPAKPLVISGQVGPGFLVGNKQIGYGLSATVLFNGVFGISTGIRNLQLANESYENNQVYLQKRGQTLANAYGMTGSQDNVISNITVKSDVLQVPLYLTYYKPLKNNWSVSFTFGTDLDVYAHQTVDFTEKGPSTGAMNQAAHIENNTQAVPFNNLLLSVGATKQVGHFMIQLAPYVCPEFVSSNYRVNDLYFGVNLSAMYILAKKNTPTN